MNNYGNIVVLIDAENVSSKYLKFIFEKIAAFGEISVRRIYGDWTTDGMRSWKESLQENAIQPIQQFRYTEGKNSSDSALIIDAMDLLYKDYFDCFCIVSSDSDFTRLAQRVREQGKYVIGIGEIKTPKAFVKGCNEFIYLNGEKQKQKSKLVPDKSPEKQTRSEILDDAFDELSRTSEWVALSKIIIYVRQMAPEFDIKDLNYKKPIDYFRNQKNKYQVRQKTEGGPGAVYIARAGEEI